MTPLDRDSRVTIDHLRAQPQGAVLRWASDQVSSERPWATAWVDVRMPGDGPPDMAWVWTILDPEDPEQGGPEQRWQFPAPFDLEIHAVIDPQEGYVKELPLPVNATPPPALVEAYDEQAHRVNGANHVRGGWSAAAITDALAAWTALHAGREDIRFEWDREAGPSAVLAEVVERIEGDSPTWDLGDGLHVHDGVLDDLLALHPKEAAKVTRMLREAHARLFEDQPAQPDG